MPDNKRQHYVPKSTLRRFASDPDRVPEPRQIDLVNIKRAKVIRGASLREQCYRDYLYGEDLVVERALGPIEGIYSALTDKMVDTGMINPRDGWNLVQMIMLQRGRTWRAQAEISTMFDRLMKLVAYGSIPEEVLRKAKIDFVGAARRNVATSLVLSPYILDLTGC